MEKYGLLSKVNRLYYDVHPTENLIMIRRRADLKIVFAMKKVETSEREERSNTIFQKLRKN